MTIIGHRGAPSYAPENTLASFIKALELGVDMIELDVYCLRSGELVVMHDDTVDRTTDGEGFIWDYNLSELHRLDAGQGQKVPLLSEVLDLVNKRVGVNIELKGTNTAAPLSRLLQTYISDKGWKAEQFLVSSFQHQVLTEFMALMPQVHSAALYDQNEKLNYAAFARKRSAYAVNPEVDDITPSLVEELHEEGLKVFVWNVKSPAQAERMRRSKVDGIFSDCPDRVGPRQLQLAH